MASEMVKRAIEVFYPVEDTKDAWNKVVLEWLDPSEVSRRCG